MWCWCICVCVCVSDDVSLCMCSEYGRQVKFTFLDSLFGGQLVSTITCEECKHVRHCCRHFNVFVMYPDSTAHRCWPLQVVSLHSCSSARGWLLSLDPVFLHVLSSLCEHSSALLCAACEKHDVCKQFGSLFASLNSLIFFQLLIVHMYRCSYTHVQHNYSTQHVYPVAVFLGKWLQNGLKH